MGALELRNLKDFLNTYNLVAENCFNKCVNSLNSRVLGADESSCADNCAQKFINVNHRVMKVYMVVQGDMMGQKIAEAQAQAAAAEVQAQAAAAAELVPTTAAELS